VPSSDAGGHAIDAMDSPELCIKRRLDEYLSEPGAEFRDVASHFSALPVYSDIGGTLFITPSQKILSMRVDETAVNEEQSPQWKLVALVAAAERFPELAQLLPVRSPETPPCTFCSGTGRLQRRLRCGECYGLGWLAL
jgi:hypothetical protein